MVAVFLMRWAQRASKPTRESHPHIQVLPSLSFGQRSGWIPARASNQPDSGDAPAAAGRPAPAGHQVLVAQQGRRSETASRRSGVPSTSPGPGSEIAACDLEPVVGLPHHRQALLSDSAQRWVVHQHTVALLRPRPTRPRSWCNCDSPRRSAFSITIRLALVHPRRPRPPWSPPADRSHRPGMQPSPPPSGPFNRPCTRPIRRPSKAPSVRAGGDLGGLHCNAPSDSSIRVQTQYARRPRYRHGRPARPPAHVDCR